MNKSRITTISLSALFAAIILGVFSFLQLKIVGGMGESAGFPIPFYSRSYPMLFQTGSEYFSLPLLIFDYAVFFAVVFAILSHRNKMKENQNL